MSPAKKNTMMSFNSPPQTKDDEKLLILIRARNSTVNKDIREWAQKQIDIIHETKALNDSKD